MGLLFSDDGTDIVITANRVDNSREHRGVALKRRTLLKNWGAGASAAILAHGASANTSIERIQRNWQSLLSPFARVSDDSELMKLTDRQWIEILSEEQYRVLREEGTELSASSELLFEDRPGVYVCAACDLPLFSSEMKYDSGTGWPSFFTSIPGALETRTDSLFFHMTVEYHCARCDGHQGHLFSDGPEPARQRWCNNGTALRFIPVEQPLVRAG